MNQALRNFQIQFGRSMQTPFTFESGEALSQKTLIPEDMVHQVKNGRIKSGLDAVATYNEQYWFRLFKTMQTSFPLVVKLLGAWNFNQVATRFLSRYPSSSPVLQNLGDGFDKYLLEASWRDSLVKMPPYSFSACRLLAQAAELDYVFTRLLFCTDTNSRYPDSGKVRLKPGVFTFHEEWKLLETRMQMDTYDKGMDGIEPGESYYAIYNTDGAVRYQSLSAPAFRLLMLIREEGGLDAGVEKAEKLFRGADKTALEDNVQAWFHGWGQRRWFFISSP